ncbi:4112_t:CDS:2, partial [Acaulospora colombiana]
AKPIGSSKGSAKVSDHLETSTSVNPFSVILYIHMYTMIRKEFYPFVNLELTQSSMWDPDGWMAYLSSIVTLRLFLGISGLIVTLTGSYSTIWTCEEVNYTLQNEASNGTLYTYPECIVNPSTSHQVIVPADMSEEPLGVASAFR